MADEFIKGFGIFTGAGLLWMVLASWYRTPSFESTKQLVAAPQHVNTVYDQMGVFLGDVLFFTTLIGTFTFWVLIPAGRQARAALSESA